jgi:hypothetical protein
MLVLGLNGFGYEPFNVISVGIGVEPDRVITATPLLDQTSTSSTIVISLRLPSSALNSLNVGSWFSSMYPIVSSLPSYPIAGTVV